jgi:hypothetical protein
VEAMTKRDIPFFDFSNGIKNERLRIIKLIDDKILKIQERKKKSYQNAIVQNQFNSRINELMKLKEQLK